MFFGFRDVSVNPSFRVAVIKAAYPMPPLPVFHVSFPSVSHHESVREVPVRDMGYDRGSRTNAGYFIKNVTRSNESLVAGQSPGADVIKGQKTGHA